MFTVCIHVITVLEIGKPRHINPNYTQQGRRDNVSSENLYFIGNH